MRIIEPSTPKNDAVTLDRSKPIVVFDPWPFAEDGVKVPDSYLMDRSGLKYVAYVGAITPDWWGLGTATDGKPVVIHHKALDKIEAGEL